MANWTPEKVSKLSNKELDHEIHYMGSRLASNDAKIASSRKQLASLKKEHGIVGTILLSKPRTECAKVRRELEEAKADKNLVLEKAMVLAAEYRKRHWTLKGTQPESTTNTMVSTTGQVNASPIEEDNQQPTPVEDSSISAIVPAETSVHQENEKLPAISTAAAEMVATTINLTLESPEEPNVANDINVLPVERESRPSIEKKEEPLSPMDAMKQRLASMRSGIAPKDEDSVILSQPVGSTGEDSFLGQLHDEEEEAKILAGRRSSTSSSCSTPKECISSVTVFEMAMANRSLLDRVSSMQSSRSSSADNANSDVSEEEWM